MDSFVEKYLTNKTTIMVGVMVCSIIIVVIIMTLLMTILTSSSRDKDEEEDKKSIFTIQQPSFIRDLSLVIIALSVVSMVRSSTGIIMLPKERKTVSDGPSVVTGTG